MIPRSRTVTSIGEGRAPVPQLPETRAVYVEVESALLIKGTLLFRKGVIVTNVPYHLVR